MLIAQIRRCVQALLVWRAVSCKRIRDADLVVEHLSGETTRIILYIDWICHPIRLHSVECKLAGPLDHDLTSITI